jgi:phosphoserine phosphatase RsbU/P
MPLEQVAAPIVVLDPNVGEARQIASWLSSAGLGAISTARTCDEAIFMLGSRAASLLIIDEHVSERSERRLLQHMVNHGHTVVPRLIRLAGDHSAYRMLSTDPQAKEIIRKPLVDEDLVQRVGCAVHRQDLIIQFRQARDQSRGHLEAAQRMQIGLLPTSEQLQALQEECRVGVGALYRSGEAVGGDLWGIWPVGNGRFALAIVDFAGHGLSAALNTFRLHALLSEKTLPREDPARMTTLLNERLHALLPRGQYATMVYLVVDPQSRDIVWCCAGGPHPLVISVADHVELEGAGLPLGVSEIPDSSRNPS